SIPGTSYKSYTLEDLQSKLQQAIADEAYELAARLRDEINKRNASQ
ncbi:MAG: hypothetical protein EOO00_15025, partial [Chitinophagaceae bacterium]